MPNVSVILDKCNITVVQNSELSSNRLCCQAEVVRQVARLQMWREDHAVARTLVHHVMRSSKFTVEIATKRFIVAVTRTQAAESIYSSSIIRTHYGGQKLSTTECSIPNSEYFQLLVLMSLKYILSDSVLMIACTQPPLIKSLPVYSVWPSTSHDWCILYLSVAVFVCPITNKVSFSVDPTLIFASANPALVV